MKPDTGPGCGGIECITVSTTWSLAAVHGDWKSDVSTSVAVPLMISFGPGVYTAFSNVVSSNEPSPNEDHDADVAPPPKEPFSVAEPV